MSHCRWVVVAEDCYQELTKVIPEAAKEEVSIKPFEEVAPVKEVTEPSVLEEKTETPESPKKVQEVLEKVQESPKVEEAVDWTSSVPPSYRKEAQQLLEKLTSTPGFSTNSGGIVEIDKVPLEDYSITTFLRTACIPFNRSMIPIRLQDWLREKGLTTFRNHLLKILPKWQNQYSWRESTMAGRKEPSGAQRPSSRKRKS